MRFNTVSAEKFKRIALSLFFFIDSFGVEIALSHTEFHDTLAFGFLLLIIPCYIFLLLSSYLEKKRFGFMFLFLLLTLFFYYGQYFVIVAGFREELSKKYVSLICGRIEEVYVIKAFFVHIRAMLMLYIGYEVRTKPMEKEQKRKLNPPKTIISVPYAFSAVATAIFVVSAICEFVVLIRNISIGNYLLLRSIDSETYRFSSGNIMFYFGYFSKWFLPSSYMLLLKHAICGEKKRYRVMIVVMFVYMFLYIQTGARFAILKVLTAMFIIHNQYVHKINKKDLRWLIPVGVVGMILFSVLSDIRMNGVSVEGITTALQKASPDYILYDILSESGATAISLANTLQYCPSLIPHKYFEFFIKMFANVLPSFLNPFYDISMATTSSVFSPLLYGYTGSGYGSSFITEVYYYWGLFLYPVLLLYGLIMGKIDSVFHSMGKMTNIVSVFSTIFLFSEMIYWVRNDVFEIARSYLYCVVLPLILVNLLSARRRKKTTVRKRL